MPGVFSFYNTKYTINEQPKDKYIENHLNSQSTPKGPKQIILVLNLPKGCCPLPFENIVKFQHNKNNKEQYLNHSTALD